MDRSKHALVPEWLKSGGSVPTYGSANHLSASASSQTDDHLVSKHAGNKSSISTSDRDTCQLSVLERTTSAYFHRSSNSNGSGQLRSTRSFGRSHHDRDWEDENNCREKEKLVLGELRNYELSDCLDNFLPSKFDKDKLRRSHSLITGKQDDTWSKKVARDLTNNKNKLSNSNGNGLLARVGDGSVHDNSFEQDFPSLGAEERQGGIGRVSSPGLSAATQTGTSPVVVSEYWKSALAEVPIIMGSVTSAQQAVPATSVTVLPNITTGHNMAEALAQGPPRSRTPPQPTAGIQRFEELAIRQSKLIPMTPSMPKTLVVSPSEKSKPKIGSPKHSVHFINHTRGPARPDSAKMSNEGRLQVLKSSRELNGISSAEKGSLSPTNGSKPVNGLLGITPLTAGSVPSRTSGNPNRPSAEHLPSVLRPTVEKRPAFQIQSRNDFFNHLKKKSSTNSTAGVSDPSPVSLSSSSEKKSSESVTERTAASVTENDGDSSSSEISVTSLSSDNRGKIIHNGDTYYGTHLFDNGEKDSNSDITPNPDEEEAAFLRSLGWDENAGEDEGLTEEEISAFYEKYMKLRASSKILHRMPPRMSLDPQNISCGVASSALSSSDSESDS
ncbi:hypothetical protein P3X46_024214 [Hevea brasiliensis]|uniref:Uncharacterized protein n=1 Tax=Hevea brasiliensis TaxID=3981 RepID=A0ABQ9L1R8_HEVBR|nr:uncharacterized protein LOC110670596 isoform X2 [Hevea brasiliensis]KAJ9158649.1 hypothetical protein P3X46_024214 [Hevea brasiliensis]